MISDAVKLYSLISRMFVRLTSCAKAALARQGGFQGQLLAYLSHFMGGSTDGPTAGVRVMVTYIIS